MRVIPKYILSMLSKSCLYYRLKTVAYDIIQLQLSCEMESLPNGFRRKPSPSVQISPYSPNSWIFSTHISVNAFLKDQCFMNSSENLKSTKSSKYTSHLFLKEITRNPFLNSIVLRILAIYFVIS